ncbi:hypothetical protein [Kitasatospora sp. NPDC004289]
MHAQSAFPSTVAGRQLARAALWIDILRRQFPELIDELAPGRPGAANRSGAPKGAAEAARRAAADRADREAALWNERHGLRGASGGRAPLRLHISDVLRDITDGVVELEEAVREKLRLGRAPRADVPARLDRIEALLAEVAGHPTLAEHVLEEARRMSRRCSAALGEAETLVRVRGRCPWCDSVSLRAFPAWRAVLCVNPGCRCTEPDCECRTAPGHRHSWAETSWSQLAQEAGVDEAALAVLVDEAEPAGPVPAAVEGAR